MDLSFGDAWDDLLNMLSHSWFGTGMLKAPASCSKILVLELESTVSFKNESIVSFKNSSSRNPRRGPTAAIENA